MAALEGVPNKLVVGAGAVLAATGVKLLVPPPNDNPSLGVSVVVLPPDNKPLRIGVPDDAAEEAVGVPKESPVPELGAEPRLCPNKLPGAGAADAPPVFVGVPNKLPVAPTVGVDVFWAPAVALRNEAGATDAAGLLPNKEVEFEADDVALLKPNKPPPVVAPVEPKSPPKTNGTSTNCQLHF